MRPELFDKGATVGHRSIDTIGWAARIVLLTAVTTAPAMAASPVSSDTPPGAIIYIRDVPTRQAQDPGQPGTPHYVLAAPQDVLTGILSVGLVPLTDDATSQITARTGAEGVAGTVMLAGGQSFLDPLKSLSSGFGGANGANSANGSGSLTGITLQAIGQATGALTSALASLSIPTVGH